MLVFMRGAVQCLLPGLALIVLGQLAYVEAGSLWNSSLADAFPSPLDPSALDFVREILDEAIAARLLTQAQRDNLEVLAEQRFNARNLGIPDRPLLEVSEEQRSWLLLNALFLFGVATATGGLLVLVHRMWKKFNSLIAFAVGLTAFSVYTLVGNLLAATSSEFVGVLLSLFALTCVPMTVYGIHQKQIQPRRSIRPSVMDKVMKSPFGRFFKTDKGLRVVSELFTLLFGLVLLSVNRFGFLVVPLLITAYLLILDLVSLVAEVDEGDWKNFLGSTILFGVCVLVFAHFLDQRFYHDYSLWMYILGSLLFALSAFVYPVPAEQHRANRHENIYLFAHLTLVCLATEQDRFIMGLVGALSCLSFWLMGIWKSFRETQKLPSVIYIRLGFALMTLALSLQVPSSLIFWQAVLGLIYFNITWTQRAHSLGTRANELTYLTHLITNLGLIYLSNKFHYVSRASLLVHSFDTRFVISFCGSLGVLLNFVWAFFLSRKILLYRLRGIYSTYRLYLATVLIFFSIYFQSYELVIIGVLSILTYLWLVLFFEVPDYRTRSWPIAPSFFLCCLTTAASSWFSFSFGFYVSSIFLLYCVHFLFRRPYPRLGFLTFTLLTCLLAAILDSTLLITFGSLGIIAYIADGFRSLIKKKSIMLPVTLFAIGGCMFVLGWIYQRYQGILRDSFIELIMSLLPVSTTSLPDRGMEIFEQAQQRVLDLSALIATKSGFNTTQLMTPTETVSLITSAMEFFFWPSYVTEQLSSMAPSTMVLLVGCALLVHYAVSRVVELIDLSAHVYESEEEAPPELDDVKLIFNLPRDTNKNGFVIEYIGNKARDFVPEKIWMEIEGEDFWSAATGLGHLSPELSKFAKTLEYPILLTPKRMPLSAFKSDSPHVRGFIHFGSGLTTGQTISQEIIRNTLRKLITFGDRPITLRLRYELRARDHGLARLKFQNETKKGVLFECLVTPSQILNSLRSTFNLVTELAEKTAAQ